MFLTSNINMIVMVYILSLANKNYGFSTLNSQNSTTFPYLYVSFTILHAVGSRVSC